MLLPKPEAMTMILISISKKLTICQHQMDSSSILTRQRRREAGISYFRLYISENLTHTSLNNKWNVLAHITEKSKGEVWIQA